MGVEGPEETHWDEETAAVYTGVQGEGRLGRAHRGAVTGRGVPQAHPQPEPARPLEGHVPGAAHTLFQPDEQRDEDQARIAELEQLLGRATRQIEILKKASTLLDAASTRNGR